MDAAEVLMSSNFGAFGGLEVNQTSALRNLEAQKRMGEIAGQPSMQRQREARARLYEAQAAEAEENIASQRRMAELIKGLPPGGSEGKAPGPEALGNQLLQLGDIAMRGGMLKQGTELITKGTTVLQHVAATEASQASVVLSRARADEAVLNQIGGLALSATDQATYDQARQAAMNDPQLTEMMKKRGIDPSRLPANFEQARPMLAALATQAQKAKDVLAAKAKELVDKANITESNAKAGAAGAAAGASRARADVLRLHEKDITKNGGDTSNGARAARKARTEASAKAAADRTVAEEARARKQASIDAARFSPVPEDQIKDPSKRTVGKTYMTPKGPLTWTGQGWRPLVETKKPAAVIAPIEDEDEDED